MGDLSLQTIGYQGFKPELKEKNFQGYNQGLEEVGIQGYNQGLEEAGSQQVNPFGAGSVNGALLGAASKPVKPAEESEKLAQGATSLFSGQFNFGGQTISAENAFELASAFLSAKSEAADMFDDNLAKSSSYITKPESVGACESPNMSNDGKGVEGSDMRNKFVYA